MPLIELFVFPKYAKSIIKMLFHSNIGQFYLKNGKVIQKM